MAGVNDSYYDQKDEKVEELEERVSSLEETVEILQKAITQLQQHAIRQSKPEPAPAQKSSEDNMKMMIAQAELEKIRHASTMKCENLVLKTPTKEEDPLDQAIKDYLNRKLQIDMIKDLTYDVTDDLF
jgi:exonuclease VII small subunit